MVIMIHLFFLYPDASMLTSYHKAIHYKDYCFAESAKDDAKVGVRWARFDASSLTAGG